MLKKAKTFLVVALTFVLVSPFASLNVFAKCHSEVLMDNFNHLSLYPNKNAKWWVINSGAGEDGYPSRIEDYCGDATCVSLEKEKGDKYIRLKQKTGEVLGYYYNAEVSEVRTGFAYGEATRWNPEVGHPVVLTAKVKWSSNYNAEGTAGAIGSSGIWLWNSPIDMVNGAIMPTNAIGFNYAPADSVLAPGLNVITMMDSWPIFTQPVAINMNVWNTFKVVWSVNAEGAQSVAYYVNDSLLGESPLYAPMSNLSVEIWNDNQIATWEGMVFDQASSEQDFDVTSIKVVKL